MARDIAINNNRQTEYNIRGDVENARDLAFVSQRIFVSIYETVDMSPPQLTDVDIEEQRGDIETAVRRSQFTDTPITVSVESIDYEAQRIQYRISTNRINETITAE